MAAWQSRTAWLTLVMSLVIVAMNFYLLQRRPGDAIIWFAILAFGFLFVAGAVALIVETRRRRN